MSLTNLPNDCLLACLARVPYADLRNAIPSTSKQLRDAVASPALSKTREAAGCVEYGVFATPSNSPQRTCYLITKAGVLRTTPRPPGQRVDWTTGMHNEVVVSNALDNMRAHAYNPGQDKWREIAPLVREDLPEVDSWRTQWLGYSTTLGSAGGHLVVLGGGDTMRAEPIQKRMDAYDPAQDTWSRLPDLPFHNYCNRIVEVNGKAWCFGGTLRPNATADAPLDFGFLDIGATFIYDPATRTWTDGPRLPHGLSEPGYYGNNPPCGFEFRKQLCVMGAFEVGLHRFRSVAFMWDATRETWDPFPAPPVVAHAASQTDDHVVVLGSFPSEEPIDGTTPTPTRLFVLDQGSRDWVEWDIGDAGTRYEAARIG